MIQWGKRWPGLAEQPETKGRRLHRLPWRRRGSCNGSIGVLRAESKIRARALQLLYAWDITDALSLQVVATGLSDIAGRMTDVIAAAQRLADKVVAEVDHLDAEIGSAADNWRLARIGAVERNILRLAVYELYARTVPPRVAIDEAIKLARWFAGPKAPGFVNGVLDTIARRMGRL